MSVLPNIARKVDRLQAFADEGMALEGETVLDTALDLYVYPILGFSVRMRHSPDLPMESAGGDHGLGRSAYHVVSAGR
jgi:hypothetical protein